MQQPGKNYDDTSAQVADTGKQKRIQRLDGAIKYYSSKKHVIFTIIGIVFGIVELVYGITYMGQCYIQPMIAIFLLVHGSVMLFEVVIGIFALLIARIMYPHYNQILARRLILVVLLILAVVNIFCFAWFIAGNVWVFGAKANGQQSTNNGNLSTYCQSDLFRAALGIIISRYVIVGIIIIVVVIRQCHKNKRDNEGGKVPPVNNNLSAQTVQKF